MLRSGSSRSYSTFPIPSLHPSNFRSLSVMYQLFHLQFLSVNHYVPFPVYSHSLFFSVPGLFSFPILFRSRFIPIPYSFPLRKHIRKHVRKHIRKGIWKQVRRHGRLILNARKQGAPHDCDRLSVTSGASTGRICN